MSIDLSTFIRFNKMISEDISQKMVSSAEDIIRYRKILKEGYDDEGRKLTDPSILRSCLKDAEATIGRIMMDMLIKDLEEHPNGV